MTIVEIQKDTTSQLPTISKEESMDIDPSSVDPSQQDVTEQEERNLASFSGSGLHASIISPIQIANLPASILEQLQQYQNGTGVNIITSLPSPHATPTSISPNNMIVNFDPPQPQPQTTQQQHPPVVSSQVPIITTTAIATGTSKKSSHEHNTSNSNKETKGLTADERRQRRLLRNRLAAKDCRRKKKEYIQTMEDTITRLESEKEALKNQIVDLKDKISKLPQEVLNSNDDNYKLMKEVTELNAKLGSMK